MGVFSVGVNAAKLENKPYFVKVSASLESKYSADTYPMTTSYGVLEFDPNDGEVSTYTTYEFHHSTLEDYARNWLYVSVFNQDSTAIVSAGDKASIRLENVYFSFLLQGADGETGAPWYGYDYYNSAPDHFYARVEYVDGTIDYWDYSIESKPGTFHYNVVATGIPEKDVQSVVFTFGQTLDYNGWDESVGMNYWRVHAYLGEYGGDGKYNLTITQPSEEATLLSGILDSVKDGFDKLDKKLGGLLDAITNLPAKLWGLIEDGLKSLFVPDEEYLVSMKDRWDLLLSEKLGAVYQVVNITLESWENINASDQKNTILIPATTLDLPDNTSFSFGGMSVKIVPDNFEFLADTCKVVSGVILTIMFINGLRKRYDEIMGVEQ